MAKETLEQRLSTFIKREREVIDQSGLGWNAHSQKIAHRLLDFLEEDIADLLNGIDPHNRVCPGCNRELKDFYNFCPECGYNLRKNKLKSN